MTRILAFLLHNWPLKVAAVMMSTILYGIIVVAQDSRELTDPVPIRPEGQPAGLAVLSPRPLGDVTRIQYLASADVPVTPDSFVATIDLGADGVDAGTTTLPIQLEAIDPRIDIVGFEPRRISVTLDEIISRNVPIRVDMGDIPDGLDPRDPVLDVESAVVRGAATAVRQVDALVASVDIESSGVDIDRDVELIPIDPEGAQVREVDVEPDTVHVQIAVLNDAGTKAVPVSTIVTGVPAPGFELAAVAVDPLVVTLQGDGDQIATLSSAPTGPISLDGATETFEQRVELALPTGILPVDQASVTVTITIRPVTGTRTFEAGLTLEGRRADRTYRLPVDQVSVVVGGSVADLDRLVGSEFQVELQVTGLDVGVHDVPVTADLPAGLTLVSSSPPTVEVTVGLPSASPSAGAPASIPSP